MNTHWAGPELELMALGVATAGERRRVLAHVASCTTCANALRAHERTVALLPAAFGMKKRARRQPFPVAGAFLAAAALLVMLLAPWRVSFFERVNAMSPPAFVAYDSRGRWMYIIVASNRIRCHVDGVTAGRRFTIGVPVVNGAVALLMVDATHRTDRLELRDDAHVLANAHISMR